MSDRFTATELEDYLVGELEPARRRAIEAAAEQDPGLAQWLQSRQQSRADFLNHPRRRAFSDLLQEAGPQTEPSRPWWKLVGLPALAVSAALLLTVLGNQPSRSTAPKFRTKGGISIEAAVLQGAASQAQLHGYDRPLHPGDRLRLSVHMSEGGFLTVLLQENSGSVSVLYKPEELGPLQAGTHVLPGSLELDRTLGRERLYILVSKERPALKTWLDELASSHQKAGFEHDWLPAGTTQVGTIEYRKVPRP